MVKMEAGDGEGKMPCSPTVVGRNLLLDSSRLPPHPITKPRRKEILFVVCF